MQVMATANDKPRALTVGAGGALATNATNLVVSGTRAFFTAKAAGGTTLQLYATDGTAAGTSVVRGLSDIPLPENFYATGDGRVFFTGGNAGKSALYISDGTAAGTVALTGNTLNLFASDDNRRRRMFTVFNGSIYFIAQQGSGPWQLWRSDGTALGTSIMTTFTTTGNNLNWLTAVGDRLYFLGLNGALYATDGITTPAVVLSDSYTRLEAVGEKLIVHPSSTSSFRLFTFSAGDTALTPLTQADFHFAPTIPSIQVGKWLYFVGATSSVGPGQVWRTDGTTAGTTQLSNGTLATDLTAVGDLVYFTDDDGTSGRELWVSDGTAAGTTRVADIIPGISTSAPANLADWAGTLYFAADDGIHGKELWRDDRTPPSVLSSGFEFAAHPANVTVQFTENVGASMALSDWRLTDRTTGMDVSNLLQAVTFDSGQEVARLTVVSAMPDGDYRLTLAAGAVADSAGNATSADASFDFFQLTGDINRDRSVDFNDLAIMAQSYNTAENTWATGDLTGDGMTDFLDLALLAQRYNTALPDLIAVSAPASVVNVAPAPVVVRTREQKPAVFSTMLPIGRHPVAPRKPVQRKGR
jgi:ELWxxDGT repeat protein